MRTEEEGRQRPVILNPPLLLPKHGARPTACSFTSSTGLKSNQRQSRFCRRKRREPETEEEEGDGHRVGVRGPGPEEKRWKKPKKVSLKLSIGLGPCQQLPGRFYLPLLFVHHLVWLQRSPRPFPVVLMVAGAPPVRVPLGHPPNQQEGAPEVPWASTAHFRLSHRSLRVGNKSLDFLVDTGVTFSLLR